MSARDELAALIWNAAKDPDDYDDYITEASAMKAADAALAAGWVPRSMVATALRNMDFGGYDPSDEGMARAARIVATLSYVTADKNGPAGWVCDDGMAVPDE